MAVRLSDIGAFSPGGGFTPAFTGTLSPATTPAVTPSFKAARPSASTPSFKARRPAVPAKPATGLKPASAISPALSIPSSSLVAAAAVAPSITSATMPTIAPALPESIKLMPGASTPTPSVSTISPSTSTIVPSTPPVTPSVPSSPVSLDMPSAPSVSRNADAAFADMDKAVAAQQFVGPPAPQTQMVGPPAPQTTASSAAPGMTVQAGDGGQRTSELAPPLPPAAPGAGGSKMNVKLLVGLGVAAAVGIGAIMWMRRSKEPAPMPTAVQGWFDVPNRKHRRSRRR